MLGVWWCNRDSTSHYGVTVLMTTLPQMNMLKEGTAQRLDDTHLFTQCEILWNSTKPISWQQDAEWVTEIMDVMSDEQGLLRVIGPLACMTLCLPEAVTLASLVLCHFWNSGHYWFSLFYTSIIMYFCWIFYVILWLVLTLQDLSVLKLNLLFKKC